MAAHSSGWGVWFTGLAMLVLCVQPALALEPMNCVSAPGQACCCDDSTVSSESVQLQKSCCSEVSEEASTQHRPETPEPASGTTCECQAGPVQPLLPVPNALPIEGGVQTAGFATWIAEGTCEVPLYIRGTWDWNGHAGPPPYARHGNDALSTIPSRHSHVPIGPSFGPAPANRTLRALAQLGVGRN